MAEFLADYTGGTAIITVLPQSAQVCSHFSWRPHTHDFTGNGSKAKPLYKEL